eukprot:Skav212863  [mRNA]  locus=scaffold151:5641:6416:- [translate_table: standard]
MDMMFDLSYSVSGEDEPFKMKFNEVVYARKGASAAAAAQAGSMLAAPGMGSLPEDTPAPAESSAGGDTSGPLFRAASAPVAPVDPAALKRNAPFSVPQMLRQVSRVASVATEPEESAEVTEGAEEEDTEEEDEEEEEEASS